METEAGAPVMETPEQGLIRARALVLKYNPVGTNLSDELIADRRAEALLEERAHPAVRGKTPLELSR